MPGTLLAIAVAVLGLTATVLWFGVHRRRKAETEIGIQSLASMKWRECIGVVLEALQREGYRQTADSTAKGGSETEFLLSRGDEKVLLGYKHGTAYHLSEANVREFVNGLHMRGARSGILLTLGSATGLANQVAISHNVQLIDGHSLWPKVRHFTQPQLLERVRKQAAAQTRHGLWGGAVGSLLAGGVIYAISDYATPPQGPIVESAALAQPVAKQASSSVPRSDAAMLEQINATARAMAEVAKLSTEQLARRRAEAARQVSLIPQVDAAIWSAQRTLLVTLNETDGKDKALTEEVCRILVQNEEMRFTRLQLESPSDSGLAVRWRLCE